MAPDQVEVNPAIPGVTSIQPEDGKDESWQVQFQLMSRQFEAMSKKPGCKGKKQWDEMDGLLQGLLEAETLLSQSIKQMRDCLLRFNAAGYPVPKDILF
jgi:hypothetical protein